MGSVLSIRAFTRLKIATLAPMPSASDSMATPLTSGVCRISRSANRMSRRKESIIGVLGASVYERFRRSQQIRRCEGVLAHEGWAFDACATNRLGLLAPLEGEAGPGVVDGAHLEIDPAAGQ